MASGVGKQVFERISRKTFHKLSHLSGSFFLKHFTKFLYKIFMIFLWRVLLNCPNLKLVAVTCAIWQFDVPLFCIIFRFLDTDWWMCVSRRQIRQENKLLLTVRYKPIFCLLYKSPKTITLLLCVKCVSNNNKAKIKTRFWKAFTTPIKNRRKTRLSLREKWVCLVYNSPWEACMHGLTHVRNIFTCVWIG